MMKDRSLKIAIVQINPVVGDLKGNREKIEGFYARACRSNPDLVIFPECALVGYPPEDLLLRQSFVRANLNELNLLAKSIVSCPAWIGFIHQRGKKIYNAAALVQNSKIRMVYEKHLLPNYGVFDEQRYFWPGSGAGVFAIKGQKLGISICEDVWHDLEDHNLSSVIPADVCSTQAKLGAKILFNISASPYHAEKLRVRFDLLKMRSRQLRRPLVYVNLVGGQDELVFDGRSMVFDSKGNLKLMGPSFREDILFCEFKEIGGRLEPAFLPTLDPPSAVDEPRQMYEALVLGTKDYAEKNGFKKVIIGLSGGIDSALVACIAVDAIGKSRVVGVTMPSKFTSKHTYKDALLLAQNLGIECKVIPIKSTHDAFMKALKFDFAEGKAGLAEENLQPRIRGTLLMALSNKWGHLVLTTGNKSEFSVGYCTLYGDTAGGFAVIKDVPKTWVYRLAHYVNKKYGRDAIPQSIIRRAPTAELKWNQKDQDVLPPYPQLDRLIHAYVEKDLGSSDLLKAGYPKPLIEKILRMIDLSEYKRRQSPPGIKITPKAFGRDRRMPITNKFRDF